ncbi:MAG: dihydrolipoyl dehydrogenase [Gammaproteobacteria bacterium]|nr:dihydrolipoyl dehydrogenase [Gammaproteobacteria bacterium]
MSNYDVIAVGGGPGGYVAAIRAAQLGLKVACIDASRRPDGKPALGGTCTNVGCIPSKALLQSSEFFSLLQNDFATHGIQVKDAKIDLAQMMQRKNQIIQQNNLGVAYLLKKNKVDFYHGTAEWVEPPSRGDSYPHRIKVVTTQGESILQSKNLVIATGSLPRPLPDLAFDEHRVLSNEGILSLTEVPKVLCVLGAGVIGLEMGSVWQRLGAKVIILEALQDFLPAADRSISQEAYKFFKAQGLTLELGIRLQSAVVADQAVHIQYHNARGELQSIQADQFLVSIGRIAQTQGLNLAISGVETLPDGKIKVDSRLQTNVPGIWAVGDVIGGPMLAHKAEEEGVAVAESIAGQSGHVNYQTIPWVIYTDPELAWVGQTEQQVQALGRAYKVGSFPFMANGRARALGNTHGLVKIIADANTDEILGVHILGPQASELIAEAAMAMEFRATSEDLARICHAHPSLAETTREAALAVTGRALHI